MNSGPGCSSRTWLVRVSDPGEGAGRRTISQSAAGVQRLGTAVYTKRGTERGIAARDGDRPKRVGGSRLRRIADESADITFFVLASGEARAPL